MGKLKRRFGNIDITPLSEGLMSAAEFEEVFDPFNQKGAHMLRKKKPSSRDVAVRDAIRKHNNEKYDPKTAPAQAIYVGLPWEDRSNVVRNVKRECDNCGRTIAVDKETEHMADNSSAILCVSCAIAQDPEQFLEDITNVRKKIR